MLVATPLSTKRRRKTTTARRRPSRAVYYLPSVPRRSATDWPMLFVVSGPNLSSFPKTLKLLTTAHHPADLSLKIRAKSSCQLALS
jgi:hypothetical protein